MLSVLWTNVECVKANLLCFDFSQDGLLKVLLSILQPVTKTFLMLDLALTRYFPSEFYSYYSILFSRSFKTLKSKATPLTLRLLTSDLFFSFRFVTSSSSQKNRHHCLQFSKLSDCHGTKHKHSTDLCIIGPGL
jgi:hypothetical protein